MECTATIRNMIEKFQCPGCVCGSDTSCPKFEYDGNYGGSCNGHVVGTTMGLFTHIALGLPKGFCRTSICPDEKNTHNKMVIRCWERGTSPEWDKFNVPVWALFQDGYLFVRTYSPRIGDIAVDIVEGGTLAMVPQAIDVRDFINDMD